MRKLFVLLFVLSFGMLLGCSNTETDYFEGMNTTYDVYVGDTFILDFNLEGIEYSCDSTLINLDGNKVTALNYGDVIIKANYEGQSKNIVVRISVKGKLEVIKTNYEVYIGDSVVIEATSGDGNNSYSTISECITLKENTVTGVKIGTGTVDVKYYSETISVSIVVINKPILIIEQNIYDLIVGDTITLEPYLSTGEGTFTYKALSDVIKVENGKVTALKKGEGKVEISYLDQVLTVSFNIKDKGKLIVDNTEITVFVGKSVAIESHIENAEGNIEYTCSSDKVNIIDNVVSVSEPGTYTINVNYMDQSIKVTIIAIYEPELLVEKTTYEISVDDEITLVASIKNGEGEILYTTSSDKISLDGNKVKGLSVGTAVVSIKFEEKTIDVTITVLSKYEYTVEDMEMYLYDTVDAIVVVTKGDPKDMVIKALADGVVVTEDNKLYGAKTGETELLVCFGEQEKKIHVSVNPLELKVLNAENSVVNVDFCEVIELDIFVPEHIKKEFTYSRYMESILTVFENKIYPKTAGTTKMIVALTEYPQVKQSITINITIDPLKVIKNIHIENVLMKKSVTTYGNSELKQSVYGSVSRYLFDDLNLIEKIVSVYSNDYEGMKATPQILEIAEGLHLPRSGIKLEEIKYIVYHDTGNNSAGANALMHGNYMISDDNIKNRARSWHYTVDATSVQHHVPDNEVTWQGDSYDAYAKSIGIETCVNYGSNLHMVWQRMGKLCAKLIIRHNLTVDSIKQHNFFSGKECPQTLRRNNLYDYALTLVEGELLVARALSKYTLTFESLNPEYVNNVGAVIKNPTLPIEVGYKVTITNGSGYNENITLYSVLNPAE